MSEAPHETDPETLNSYTPPGLYMFLDLAMKRGNLTAATGTALRVGSKKVLDIEGNDAVDLRSIDLDDLIDRFKRLTNHDLSEKSQETYEVRVRKAITMYVKFVDRDPTWKQLAAGKGGARAKKATTTKSSNGTTPPVEEAPVVEQVTHTPAPRLPVEDENTVEVPVPLSRDGHRKAKLVLPVDMTDKEAKKISGIVELYVMPEQLAITTGEPTE